MSTVSEIEAALQLLNQEELKRVEAAVERAQKEHADGTQGQAASRLQAFEQLKTRLALDERKVEEWKAAIRDARR